jgi:hypothetical protein
MVTCCTISFFGSDAAAGLELLFAVVASTDHPDPSNVSRANMRQYSARSAVTVKSGWGRCRSQFETLSSESRRMVEGTSKSMASRQFHTGGCESTVAVPATSAETTARLREILARLPQPECAAEP